MVSVQARAGTRRLSCVRLHVLAVPLAALLIASAAPAYAQSGGDGDLTALALEDLLNVKVYAASKFVQDVAQAPASVTIVPADEIRRHGYRTLADVLRGVRGFYVTDDRNYRYVGVRGFLRPGDYNGRLLLLVNGHRMNDTIYEQALLGTESPIDIDLVDRVEVIRGPSSSIYGTSAFFAVVNVITRTGRSLSGGDLGVDAGSQARLSARATAGGRTARGAEGLLSLSAFRTDGNNRIYYPEFDLPPVSNGYAVNLDDDRAARVFASGSAGHFTGQAAFGTRTKQVPTASFDTLFGDPRQETTDTRGFADLRYERRLDPRTTVEARGSLDVYRYDGAFPYSTGMFLDSGRAVWMTGEVSAARQIRAHAVTFGAEARHNLRQDQAAKQAGVSVLDDRRRSDVVAGFVEDEFRPHRAVIVNAGLRWDEYIGIFGGALSPRVGVIVTPTAGSTVKGLYGRAFRAPNPFELYYDQNALSARLTPEYIQTYELTWDQRLTPRLQASLSAFRNGVSDLISQRGGADTLDGLYFRNGDHVTATGFEAELQGELPGRVRTRVAHAVQNARLDETGVRISNSPRRLTTMVVDGPLPWHDLVLAFDGFTISARRSVAQQHDVKAAFVANLTLSRQPTGRGIGVGVSVYNVFGARYADPGSVEHRQSVLPQDGRTALVRTTWRFRP